MSYDPVSPNTAEVMVDSANGRSNSTTDEEGNFCSNLFSCFGGDDDDDDDEKREEEERRLKKEEEKKKREEEFERTLETMPAQQRLFYFAKKGNIEAIKEITKNQIDKHAKDYDGLPRAGDEEPYATHNTALHFAVLSLNVECVELVWSIFQIPIDDRNKLESTPLHVAASLGCTDIVQWLIEKKAETDVRNKIGNTALHCSVAANHLETTQCILKALDDPMQALVEPNGVGVTPEKYAVSADMIALTRKYLPQSSQNYDNNNNNPENPPYEEEEPGQTVEEEPAEEPVEEPVEEPATNQ